MPITTIPLVFNLITGMMIWYSDIPSSIKIILTSLVVAKYLLFFFIALISESDFTKTIGVIVGVALNVTVIAIALVNGVATITINTGVTLGLLLLWYIVTSFSISKGEENER